MYILSTLQELYRKCSVAIIFDNVIYKIISTYSCIITLIINSYYIIIYVIHKLML